MSLPLTVPCFSKIQIGFTFLVLAHLGSPGQRVIKRVCVCVSFIIRLHHCLYREMRPVVSVVAWFVSALITSVCCAKMAEPIDMMCGE